MSESTPQPTTLRGGPADGTHHTFPPEEWFIGVLIAPKIDYRTATPDSLVPSPSEHWYNREGTYLGTETPPEIAYQRAPLVSAQV